MFKLTQTRLYKIIKSFLQSVYLWNTTISLYHVAKILWRKIITFDIDQRAAAVSYSFILAIFPGTIFLFTLIPYIPIKHFDKQIMDFLQSVMPQGIYENAADTVHDIVSRRRSGILSFGFIFAVYAATNGMMALMRAFNMALKTREKRSYLKARLIALLLTFLLTGIQVAAILVLIVGRFVLDFLKKNNVVSQKMNVFLFQLLRYSSIFLIFYIGISLIYYLAPAVKRRIKFFNFGSLVASILSILATNLFSFYIANFNSYNRLYGSIGTIIAMMVWIYLIALILIFGFEINTSLRDALLNYRKAKTPQQSSVGGISQ